MTGPFIIDQLAAEVIEVCKLRRWSLHWTARGAYLHLEASELIEAIRGKNGEPLGEAADVLIVLMSITQNAGIAFSDVMVEASKKLEELKSKPIYKGEERMPETKPTCKECGGQGGFHWHFCTNA